MRPQKFNIQNLVVCRLLAFAATHCNGPWFSPINEWVRKRYTGDIQRLLQAFMRRGNSPEISLVPRHSVTTSQEFSLWQSDIDYTLISNKLSSSQAWKISERYETIRRFFPFVGELELFETKEFIFKKNLQKEFGPYLELIRLLRKWHWQAEVLQTAFSDYHEQKAYRAIGKIQKQLGIVNEAIPPEPWAAHSEAIGSPVRKWLKNLPTKEKHRNSEPVFGYSAFLEWHLCNKKGKRPGVPFQIALPEQTLLVLLTLLPDGEEACPSLKSKIDRLRRDPKISQVFFGICSHELLMLQTKKRTEKTVRTKDFIRWERKLIDLKRHHSPSAFTA